MLPGDFVIKNVDVWTNKKVQKARDVFVASGALDKIVPSGSVAYPQTSVEGKGKVLMPSGLDLQVHLRSPGQYHKENPETAAHAALRGGYAYLLAMPNTFPTVDTPEILKRCYREYDRAHRELGVVIGQTSAMSYALRGEKLVDFGSMKAAGAVSFTDDGVALVDDDLMLRAFREAAKHDVAILQHAELPGHGGALARGRTQTRLKISEYPRDSESRLVERDLRLLRQVPEARYHVLHVTTKASVELIRAAKKEGLRVTGEASPHHLYFCSEDIPEDNTSFKMNPPLFWAEDREVLREAIVDGSLDFVATDHAPHESWGKSRGFQKAPFGTTGLETSIRVLLWLLKAGHLPSPEHLVELFSTAPARYLGMENEGWGHLEPGRPFRAFLLDTDAPERPVEVSELESLSKNNLFLGTSLPGKVLGHFTTGGYFPFEK